MHARESCMFTRAHESMQENHVHDVYTVDMLRVYRQGMMTETAPPPLRPQSGSGDRSSGSEGPSSPASASDAGGPCGSGTSKRHSCPLYDHTP